MRSFYFGVKLSIDLSVFDPDRPTLATFKAWIEGQGLGFVITDCDHEGVEAKGCVVLSGASHRGCIRAARHFAKDLAQGFWQQCRFPARFLLDFNPSYDLSLELGFRGEKFEVTLSLQDGAVEFDE